MEYNELIEGIMGQLKEKYPEVADFSLVIAGKLGMDRRGVKRRLNGEMKFSLPEFFDIAKEFRLSLDRMYAPEYDTRDFVELYGADNQRDEFNESLQQAQDIYKSGCGSAESFFGLVTISLPTILWSKREWVRSLFFYIWHHSSGARDFPAVAEVLEDQVHKNAISGFADSMAAMQSSVYVVSPTMFKDLCDTACFFYKLKVLSYEDMLQMGEDMSLLIDSFEEICVTGRVPDTGNKISIHILQKPLKTDFAIIESTNINCGVLYTMGLYPLTTVNTQTFETVKGWFKTTLQASMLISESNELERSVFFEKQRTYLSRMLASL